MPMPNTHRTIIIIQAADQARANAAATTLPGADTADTLTFTVPLNPSGLPSDPITHYWAAPVLSDTGYAMVQQMQPAFTGSTVQSWDIDTDPGGADALLVQLGLKRIQAAI